MYVFHDELHKLGQYALNQRHFYEWIGNVNTFDLPVLVIQQAFVNYVMERIEL